jgi:hypothetical protein
MKTLAHVSLNDGGTAEVLYGLDVQPDGRRSSISISAVLPEGDAHRLGWDDQFALLDTAWLILVELRRAAERRRTAGDATLGVDEPFGLYTPHIVLSDLPRSLAGDGA